MGPIEEEWNKLVETVLLPTHPELKDETWDVLRKIFYCGAYVTYCRITGMMASGDVSDAIELAAEMDEFRDQVKENAGTRQ